MSAAGTGVFVLGMHRSGTSVATRAINLLGVPLAPEDELKPASPNNPTGFWEVKRLTDFNNRLLAELGGSSLGPPALEHGWSAAPELEERRKRARKVFAKAHRTETWVWKDPRNCVLLPFWREALDVRPIVVLVDRDPAAVARSLEARQGLSAAMSYAVWERYMREALSAVEGLPVFVAPYDRLVEDPLAWANDMGRFLRTHGLPTDANGAGELSGLIEPKRGAGQAPPALELSGPQRELATTLASLAGAHDSFPRQEVPPETPWTEPLLAERRRADVLRQQMEERLAATRRRLRAARAGESQAEELPKRGARGGRTSRLGRLTPRRPRSIARLRGGDGRLPDYLIIGAQKSGTSSLFRYLGESARVVLPSEKEVHFFDNQFDNGVEWYRSHFPAAHGRRRTITGEASPYYMFHPLAPRRIRETIPEVRLIAVLRNPVHRAVSHYYHEVGNGFEDLPLPVALDREPERLAGEAERIAAEPGYQSFSHRHFSYQARGVYVDQLTTWRSFFPADQLLVLNSDSLFAEPVETMRRVYDFLELPGRPPRDLGAYNRRDYPAIPADVQRRLERHFAGHNARLREHTGQDFGWPG